MNVAAFLNRAIFAFSVLSLTTCAGNPQVDDSIFHAEHRSKLKQHPGIYQKVILTELSPPHKLKIAPPECADRVLTFRNIHNWMKQGQAQAVFNAMYAALQGAAWMYLRVSRN